MAPPPAFTDAFQEELIELDELSRHAYAAYLTARDALFARYDEPDFPELGQLWRSYCEATETLARVAAETERFIGADPFIGTEPLES